VLGTVIENISNEHFSALQSADLFPSISGAIIEHHYSPQTIILGLKILRFARSHPPTVPWYQIAEVTRRLEFTKELYSILISILSRHFHASHPVIDNWAAAPLIGPILESSFCLNSLEFLKKLSSMSIHLCYKLVNVGLAEQLIALLNHPCTKEIGSLACSILVDILSVYCPRSVFLAFMKLLNSGDFQYISCLRQILEKHIPHTNPFLQFGSVYGVIRLPSLGTSFFDAGFIVSLDLRIAPIFSESVGLPLMRVSNEHQSLIFVLRRSQLELITKRPKTTHCSAVSIKFPESEWFTLSFLIDDANFITLSMSGSSIGIFSWESERMTECELFGGKELGYIHCQVSKISVGSNDESTPVMVFDPSQCERNEMLNTTSFFNWKASFEGDLFSMPATFWEVFSASLGIPNLLCLFSRLGSNFDTILISLISRLLKRDCNIEHQLIQWNSFEIIAHFLLISNLGIAKLQLFVDLLALFAVFKQKQTRKCFFQSLIINY
jgi:hypothetical protein